MSPLLVNRNNRYQRAMPEHKLRSFIVAPAKPQDVRRLVDIEFHAFENERVNQVLSYRDCKKPAHFERSVKAYQKALDVDGAACRATKCSHPSFGRPGSKIHIRKVLDIETGDITSFAKSEFKAYTPAELHEPEDVGHEGEPRMNRDWFALNERQRRQYVGVTEHCYVAMLATEPKHQHNGAGTLLLESILQEADKAGVEIYLEATDTAKPLYERHGFIAITELRFNPAKYGVEGLGSERQTVMVRGALGKHGKRNPVRSWETATAQAKSQLRYISMNSRTEKRID